MRQSRPNGVLNDQLRVILFWFTLAAIIIVVSLAVFTILRSCQGPIREEEPPLEILPLEVTLCTGQRQQFSAAAEGVSWEATGGTVTDGGLYTAGGEPGDYAITAKREGARKGIEATVHIVACTPTPTPLPQPTATPLPQPTSPPPEPTATPVSGDAQGDVGDYDDGSPVDQAPAGVDIQAASVAPDLRIALDSRAGAPPELAEWAGEDEILLWIEFYDSIPNPPGVYADWLFAMDVDGNSETGRTPGAVRVNPDFGDESVIGVSFDPDAGAYSSYLLIWDQYTDDWATGSDIVRATITEDRTALGLAVPRDTYLAEVAEISGIEVLTDSVRGRAAALSYVGAQAVIDFYPDRP